ncbi:MAG TPA: O-antigen ligase family protein [Solirubrobacteraceae bacterium]|nr:O-antigen ligase family protein [Solirubrobacteraceae bacterium]
MTSTVLVRAKSASRTIPLIVVAAGGAALVGLLANSGSSKIVAGAVGALLLGALIARAPEWTFGACLLVLCYSPEYMGSAAGVFGQPQLQKGIVYFAALGMALHRGVRPRYLIVPAAYAVMAILAKLNGQLIPGLTLTQMLSSFVTLTVGWTALSIKWDRERDARYLKVLSCLPVACVLLGVLLQGAGLHTLFDHGTGFDSTTRLQGASGPAQLALTSLIACVTASICYRVTRWRWAPMFVVADAAILALTVSRGAAIALAVALAWPIIRLALSGSSDKRWVPQRWARIAIVCVAAAGAASLVVPSLLARQDNATFIPGQGVIYDKTSGRSKAWSEFYAIAQRSPLFGHGLGAGPITKIQEKGFLAQHNEYLRLFLEGGYIGGGIVLLAMIIVIATCIRLAPRRIRLDLFGLVVGFAILSYTDNTLTSVNLQLPFCLVFGILASNARQRVRAAPVSSQPAVMPPIEPPVPVAG